MYDPTIGRWISEDPIGFTAGDANLYRYVQNAPTNATDPSGLQPPGPNQPAQVAPILGAAAGGLPYVAAQAVLISGAARVRRMVELVAGGAANFGEVYDMGGETSRYRQRGEHLTAPVASAVFFVWERIVRRGLAPGARPDELIEAAVDQMAGDILRTIEERTAGMSFADPHAVQLLMRVPIGINHAASEASYAIALDTLTREQVRRLDSSNHDDRVMSEGRLRTLFRTQPLAVAAILRDYHYPTISLEQKRRIEQVVNPADLREFERANSSVFRKHAEAIFREYLSSLPSDVVDRIMAIPADPALPNQARLANMIRGR